MTYQIYVGSNNQTKQLELFLIEQILADRHVGFTLEQATGYWKGEKEATAVITIADTSKSVMQTIRELKIKLNQDAIAYQIVPEMRFA
jgi:hypothetical protein